VRPAVVGLAEPEVVQVVADVAHPPGRERVERVEDEDVDAGLARLRDAVDRPPDGAVARALVDVPAPGEDRQRREDQGERTAGHGASGSAGRVFVTTRRTPGTVPPGTGAGEWKP